jgi:hypothetical protein
MGLYTLSFVGVYPVGAILAGAMADAVGTANAYVLLSSAGIVLGLAATRSGLPILSEIESPEFSADRAAPIHAPEESSGPVMILNSWTVDLDEIDDFLRVMRDLRFVRLRTGAYRWRLYREAGDPRRLTEAFLTVTWEEHLNQHARIDDASARVIGRARGFDVRGEPITRHLLAVDTEGPPNFDELLAAHSEMHAVDGSIPLPESLERGDGS